MVHTHHANVRCPDCGEKHSPGAMLDCVDVLKERLQAEHDLAAAYRYHLDNLCEAVEDCTEVREGDRHAIYDRDVILTRLDAMLSQAKAAL